MSSNTGALVEGGRALVRSKQDERYNERLDVRDRRHILIKQKYDALSQNDKISGDDLPAKITGETCMLLIYFADYAANGMSQDVIIGADYSPPSRSELSQTYVCGEVSYVFVTAQTYPDVISVSSLEIDGEPVSEAVRQPLDAAISRYRSLFTLSGSCRLGDNGLRLFLRGYLADYPGIDALEGALTTVQISARGHISIDGER